MKILVVDDAPAVRTRLAEMLEEIPEVSRVLVAGSAAEARRSLEAGAPDVVVLDLQLGEENGAALLPEIRTACPGALLVVLTNDPSEHRRRECVLRGADLFFDKSKDFARALELVAGWLKERRRRA